MRSSLISTKLDFAPNPSDDLIRRLASALDAHADGLHLMAEKIPARIRQRVLERPDAFGVLAQLDDAALNRVLKSIRARGPTGGGSRASITSER